MKQDNSGSPVNWKRVLLLAGVFSLGIIYLLLWLRMIASPAQRTGADFIAFYAGGRVAQEYGVRQTYNISLQQEVQEAEVGFELSAGQVLLYNHVPYLVPLLHGLVSSDYVASFVRWAIVLAFVYAISLYVLARILPADMSFADRRMFMAGAATFYPFFVSLLLGQDTAFVFLGAALLTWGVIQKRDWVSGAGLALVTIRPHFAIFLALPFLFARRKVFAWFVGFAGVLALVSVAMLGIQGTKDFIGILSISAGGEWYGMKEQAMFNLIGLFSRLLPFVAPSVIRAVGWGIYLTVILAFCIWSAQTREMNFRMLNWMFLTCILVVPHFHYHDLTLLLFPLLGAGLTVESVPFYRGLRSALQPLAVSFIFLAGSFNATINFSLPYVIILGAAVLLYRQRAGMIMNITRE
jgi:hypothetical protein